MSAQLHVCYYGSLKVDFNWFISQRSVCLSVCLSLWVTLDPQKILTCENSGNCPRHKFHRPDAIPACASRSADYSKIPVHRNLPTTRFQRSVGKSFSSRARSANASIVSFWIFRLMSVIICTSSISSNFSTCRLWTDANPLCAQAKFSLLPSLGQETSSSLLSVGYNAKI